jgi:hypothetical protein
MMEQRHPRFKLYRVKTQIQAVKRDGTGVEEIVNIYPGTTVLVTGEARQSGMVDILADGEFVSVLQQQLEEHGDQTA